MTNIRKTIVIIFVGLILAGGMSIYNANGNIVNAIEGRCVPGNGTIILRTTEQVNRYTYSTGTARSGTIPANTHVTCAGRMENGRRLILRHLPNGNIEFGWVISNRLTPVTC